MEKLIVPPDQPSKLVATNDKTLKLAFLPDQEYRAQSRDDVSVWCVKIQTLNGELNAVLKAFHAYGEDDGSASQKSAATLSGNIWKLWHACERADHRAAVLSAV